METSVPESMTSASCLPARELSWTFRPEQVATATFGGDVVDVDLVPGNAEIIQMHSVIYNTRDEIPAVIDTHSPTATACAMGERVTALLCGAPAALRAVPARPCCSLGPSRIRRFREGDCPSPGREPRSERRAARKSRAARLRAGPRSNRASGDCYREISRG